MNRVELEKDKPINKEREEIESFALVSGDLVLQAMELATERHGERERKDGSLYLSHVVEVGRIIKEEWEIDDEKILAAAVMHDLVEDEGVGIGEIEERFGEKVAYCVEGVSKYRSAKDVEISKERRDKETLRKVVEYSTDPAVLLIKLADRIHNMRTMEVMSRKQQIRKARETMDVYVEMAEAMGLWKVKNELEDWSFYYLFPERFRQTKHLIDYDERREKGFTDYVSSRIEQKLKNLSIKGRVEVMFKGYWEAEEKRERAVREGRNSPDDFDNISDIVSFRVVLADRQAEYERLGLGATSLCKALLGELEEEFVGEAKVDVERMDDYLVNPTLNGYRAVHQVMVFEDKGPVEIAATLESYEEFNNWGVVSLKKKDRDWRDEKERLKMVFTPTGKVLYLPEKATVLDVAARIDSKLAWRANGAWIDGNEERIAGLTAVVQHGSTIKIQVGPGRDWENDVLEYCLPQTKDQLEPLLIEEGSLEARQVGRRLVEKILREKGFLRLEDLELVDREIEEEGSWQEKDLPLRELLFHTGCDSEKELYSLVGSGFWSREAIEELVDEVGLSKKMSWSTIRVSGDDQSGVLAKLTEKISELGLNIKKEENVVTGDEYTIWVIVKDMREKQRNDLREFLEDGEVFGQVDIV